MRVSIATIRAPSFVIKVKHILTLLLVGGLIGLTEVSGRQTFLESYNIDAVRNLALIVVAALTVLMSLFQRGGKLPTLLPLLPYLIFLGWALFSLLWTSEPQYSLREASKLIYPVFFFILVRLSLQNRTDAYSLYNRIRQIFVFFAIIGIIAAVLGIIIMLRNGTWQWGISRLLNIPFQMETMAACIYVLIDFVGWRTLPKWKPNKLLLVTMTIYVFLSLTRAYIFGLVLAIAMVFVVTSRSRLIWPLFVTIGSCFVILLLVVDNPVKSRMFWNPEEVTLGSLTEIALTAPSELVSPDFIKLSGRVVYFQVTLKEAQSRRPALIGAGLGSSRPIINMYFPTAAVAHGDYLSYSAELGYIGFVLLLSLYATTFWGSLLTVIKKRRDPLKRAAATLLFSLITLVSVVSIVYNAFVHIFVLHTVAVAMLAIICHKSTSTVQIYSVNVSA